MSENTVLTDTFFHDLKEYNNKNFRDMCRLDINQVSPKLLKAFSSVITRYFIFLEHHSDLSLSDSRLLFFKLRIDMIGRYFSEYPDTDSDMLRPFQQLLIEYAHKEQENEETAAKIPDINIETASASAVK